MDGTTVLDGVSLRIAGVLLADPRATIATIAGAAGTSAATASRRVAALTESGVVRVVGVADREWARAGYTVWLRARCEPGMSLHVAREIASWPESGYVAITGGELDCAAQLAVRSSDHLLELTDGRLRTLDGVIASATLKVIRRFATPHGWTAGVLDERTLARVRSDRWDRWTEDGGTAPTPTDALDERILDALADDGRLSWRELAGQVGVGPATVCRRVEALMRKGPLRVRAVVEPWRVQKPVVALVWMRVLPSRLEVAGRTLAQHPDVLSVAATTGQHNLCGEVAVADDACLYRFLTTEVGAIPGVSSVDVTDGLDVIKRASQVFSRAVPRGALDAPPAAPPRDSRRRADTRTSPDRAMRD